MSFEIIRNYYAPMCGDWDKEDAKISSHAILYRGCNFACSFCSFKYLTKVGFLNLSDDEFVLIVHELLRYGNRFKFSGGEPTIYKELPNHIRIVKEMGGYVFLDTNGSRPDVLCSLLDNHLVDVLGISLKGLSPKEAINTSNVKESQLCWENVLKSIEMASSYNDVRVIITYVFYNNAELSELERFSEIISCYPNVYLKINNLHYSVHNRPGLTPIDSVKFIELAQTFINCHPKWKGHVIVVNSQEAISDYDKILFL